MKAHFKKRKMKLLVVKLSSLKSELKVSKEILHSAGAIVDEKYRKEYSTETKKEKERGTDIETAITPDTEENNNKKQEVNNTSPHPPGEDTKSYQSNVDPEVKKLFRQIATSIHPDKLEELPPGPDKDNKLELYSRARAALEENDLMALADIAMEMEMEVPEISSARLKKAQQEISSIKAELSRIESTMVWHWFFCDDPARKEQILSELLEKIHENNSRS
jgi:hypothetical protein